MPVLILIVARQVNALYHFVEQQGYETEANGLSPSAGRILGLLLISGEPLSFTQIANVSRLALAALAAIRTCSKKMAMIEHLPRQGGRQDYFQVPAEVWQSQIEGQMRRTGVRKSTCNRAPKRRPAPRGRSQTNSYAGGDSQTVRLALR